jgi:hypothetical protein
MTKILFWTLVLALPALAHAAPPPAVQKEISALMDALAGSGCQFQRNGRWYGAGEARKHLQRKYDYLQKKDLVASSEQFIARAASESSVSGNAYRVRCPGQPEQPSARWFSEQLRRLRGAGS